MAQWQQSKQSDPVEIARRVLAGLGDTSRFRLLVDRPDANALVFASAAGRVVRLANAAPLRPEREARVCAEARRAGVPAPIVEAFGQQRGRAFLVYERLPGLPMRGQSVERAAVVLRKLHEGADVAHFPEELVARRRRLRRFELAQEALDLVPSPKRAVVRHLLQAAEEDWLTNRCYPTHGDFRRPNILASGSAITGVVDWSDSRRASIESDLGNIAATDLPTFIRAYSSAGEDSARLPDLKLVAGYASARHLALARNGVFHAAQLTSAMTLITQLAQSEECV